MTIALTKVRQGRGFAGNDKEILYLVQFTAEAYSSGVELNSTTHFLDADGNEEFSVIDTAFEVNKDSFDTVAVPASTRESSFTVENTGAGSPKVTCRFGSSAYVEHSGALTRSCYLMLLGAPVNVPSSVLK